MYVNQYYDVEGSKGVAYVYGNGLKVATVRDDVIAFHHLDHLSGSNASTDAEGGVLELNDYYPYGASRVDQRTGDYTNDYLFTGKELDRESGLYYYGARYYDPALGRFISVDPAAFALPAAYLLDPQQWNGYSYVRNNPLRYVDPDGQFLEEIGQVGAGARNAVVSNTVFGAGRVESDDPYYNAGQRLGDGLSVVQGALEVLIGEATAAAGVVISATGVGAVAGVPLTAAGIAVQGHGVGTAGTAIVQMAKDDMDKAGGSIAEDAKAISKEINKGSVTIETEAGKTRYHLTGESHFEKTINADIETPHVHEAVRHTNPTNPNTYNFEQKPVRPMNEKDIDAVRGSNCFPDVKDEWFATFVCVGAQNNIIKGYPDGTFRPSQNINVVEALKITLNAFHIQTGTTQGAWYQTFVDYAKASGLFLDSFTDYTKKITREEMAELVHRIIKSQ